MTRVWIAGAGSAAKHGQCSLGAVAPPKPSQTPSKRLRRRLPPLPRPGFARRRGAPAKSPCRARKTAPRGRPARGPSAARASPCAANRHGRNGNPDFRSGMPGLWWAVTGSNRRPSRCKRDALPTELTAQGLRRLPPASRLRPGGHPCRAVRDAPAPARSSQPYKLHDRRRKPLYAPAVTVLCRAAMAAGRPCLCPFCSCTAPTARSRPQARRGTAREGAPAETRRKSGSPRKPSPNALSGAPRSPATAPTPRWPARGPPGWCRARASTSVSGRLPRTLPDRPGTGGGKIRGRPAPSAGGPAGAGPLPSEYEAAKSKGRADRARPSKRWRMPARAMRAQPAKPPPCS